jgi:hypothetical protein
MSNEEFERLNRQIDGMSKQHAIDSRTLREYAAERDALRTECAAWKEMYHAERARIYGAPSAEAEWDGGADLWLHFLCAPDEFRGCRWNAMQSEKLDGKRVALVVIEQEKAG